MNQTEYFGMESIKNLKDVLEENHAKNVFLVTGRGSYESCGAKAVVDTLLEGYNVTRFFNFEINPKLDDAARGVELFREKNYDVIIGIGGGTVIDMAKLIKIFAAQSGNLIDYVQKKEEIESRGKLLVAIPTTAGTGSEATHFAVVYVDKVKYSLAHRFILPEYSIVDPKFTLDLPPRITASTGIDAFSQAIESFWAVNSTKESKEYAKEAIKLIMNNLVDAVNNPSEESRSAMAKAANLAGKAINISKTTVPHAVSYPFTSYFKVPHGHAVGLTLGSFLVYNEGVSEKDVLDKRGFDYVKNTIKEICLMFGADNASDAKIILEKLMINIGLEVSLERLGIDDKGLSIIIKNGFSSDRVNNNPRKLTSEKLLYLLRSLG
ncbi:phosphonoacetaldehyde reductase [Candidatus Woesearchaeota archaeon]|nr:phosphonoacetaldehyde reductase [Candidatus Woesearchaeota archaeon]